MSVVRGIDPTPTSPPDARQGPGGELASLAAAHDLDAERAWSPYGELREVFRTSGTHLVA
jgi:hypothetical protein